jgi:hypothetical protein
MFLDVGIIPYRYYVLTLNEKLCITLMMVG